MEPLDIAEGFIELCQSENRPASWLAAGFQKATEALGFRHFACCAHVDPLHPPPQAIMIHNYPADWVQHYSREKLYEIDPVLQRAESNPMAFMWDTTFQVEPITAAQGKMLVDATEFGIAHGFTIPIHLSWLPGTLRASCSIVPDAPTVSGRNYFIVGAMVTALYAALNRVHPPRREAGRSGQR
jgi:Autoinducer binding domain